jgi:hypothetical protein
MTPQIPHWFIPSSIVGLVFTLQMELVEASICFITLQSFLYKGVRGLVSWLDLWKKLSPPIILQFHSVHASPQHFYCIFSCCIFGLILVSGVYRAVVIRHGLSSDWG